MYAASSHSVLLLDQIDGVNRDAWLALHRSPVVTSSEILAVCGLDQYRSPLELWAYKTGRKPPVEQNDFMWLGHQMEPIISALFSRRTGLELLPQKSIYRHAEFDWATASPDNFWLYSSGAPAGIVECKNTTHWNQYKWGDTYAPEAAVMQLNWQAGVIGLTSEPSYVAGLVGGSPEMFYMPKFNFSPDLFSQCMELAEKFLWFVRNDTPPDASARDRECLLSLLPTPVPENEFELGGDKVVRLLEDYNTAVNSRLDMEAELKFWKDKEDTCKNRLEQMMGNNSVAVLPDGRYAVRRETVYKQKVYPAKTTVGFSILKSRPK